MFHKSKGIVLQTVKFGETSLIAKIFTDTHGIVSFVVNGARTAKPSAKAAMLQLGTLVEIDYSYQGNKGLQRFKEIKRAYVYKTIPFDMAKSAILLFTIELIAASIQEHEPNDEEFDYIFEHFILLDSIQPDAFFHIRFMIAFARFLGFYPDDNYSEKNRFFDLNDGRFVSSEIKSPKLLTAEESQLLWTLMHTSNNHSDVGKKLRKSLLQKLLQYYAYHLENFREIKSYQIFESVFE